MLLVNKPHVVELILQVEDDSMRFWTRRLDRGQTPTGAVGCIDPASKAVEAIEAQRSTGASHWLFGGLSILLSSPPKKLRFLGVGCYPLVTSRRNLPGKRRRPIDPTPNPASSVAKRAELGVLSPRASSPSLNWRNCGTSPPTGDRRASGLGPPNQPTRPLFLDMVFIVLYRFGVHRGWIPNNRMIFSESFT